MSNELAKELVRELAEQSAKTGYFKAVRDMTEWLSLITNNGATNLIALSDLVEHLNELLK